MLLCSRCDEAHTSGPDCPKLLKERIAFLEGVLREAPSPDDVRSAGKASIVFPGNKDHYWEWYKGPRAKALREK